MSAVKRGWRDRVALDACRRTANPSNPANKCMPPPGLLQLDSPIDQTIRAWATVNKPSHLPRRQRASSPSKPSPQPAVPSSIRGEGACAGPRQLPHHCPRDHDLHSPTGRMLLLALMDYVCPHIPAPPITSSCMASSDLLRSFDSSRVFRTARGRDRWDDRVSLLAAACPLYCGMPLCDAREHANCWGRWMSRLAAVTTHGFDW